MEVRVVLRTIVVEAEELAQACNGDGLGGLGEDGEGVLRHVILDRRAELALQPPHAWIVVRGVEFDIAYVGSVEVKFALGWVVEPVLDGELNEVVRGQVIGIVLRVILAEAALIAGDEVLIFGDARGEPAVSRGRL